MGSLTDEKEKRQYDRLVRQVSGHAYRYYVLDSPQISDREYDALYKKLLDIEERHPGWIRSDSPTRRVAPEPKSDLKKVTRAIKMGSLDNTYDRDDLKEFHRRVTEGLPSSAGGPAYVVEPKIDGVSLELTYRDGRLALATTRGDGTVGEDVTENARTIRMIPLGIEEKGEVIVRGEVFIHKRDFEQVNRQREEAGEELFANPRNAAAGSLRILDARVVAARPLRLYVWDLVEGEKRFERHALALEWLGSLGLPMHGKHIPCAGFDDVLKAIEALEKEKGSLTYQIDGAVIKVDAYRQRSILGETARFPRWAVAFKYEAEKALTRIVDIQLGMGRTGILTPVAELEPVHLSGTTVTHASLHNADLIEEKDIRIGDLVEVEKAGEIIPYVLRALHDERKGTEKKWAMPDACPHCAAPIVRKEGEVAVRCPNRACGEQVKAKIHYFARRGAMDIANLGPSLISQLTGAGLVRDVADLYGLKKDDLVPLERMAEKSASNVIEAIAASRKGRAFDRLILSLGIGHVGEVAAKKIAQIYPHLPGLLAGDTENIEAALSDIDGIGPVIAASVRDFLDDADNRRLLEKLVAAGIETTAVAAREKEKVEGPLSAASFCVTGVLSLPRETIHAMIRAAGGEIHTSIKKGTTYLVAGEKVGASKISKAKKHSTKVISEEELKKML
ncbi:MAG: NAD-dependent DNA ligase LigA [Pseudomonadota bacterium]